MPEKNLPDFNGKYIYIQPFKAKDGKDNRFNEEVIRGEIINALMRKIPQAYMSVDAKNADITVRGEYEISGKGTPSCQAKAYISYFGKDGNAAVKQETVNVIADCEDFNF